MSQTTTFRIKNDHQFLMRRLLPVGMTIALVVYFILLIVSGERNGNTRHLKFLSQGTQTSTRLGNVSGEGGNLVVAADGTMASAEWNEYAEEIGQLLSRAESCRMRVAIVGIGLSSGGERAAADVLVNGTAVEHVTFSAARRGLFPINPGRLYPANVKPELVELVPLDAEYGFVIPISQRFCSSQRIVVGIRVRNAAWSISHAGILLDYEPSPFLGNRGAIFAIIGSALIALEIAALYFILRRMSRVGTLALVVTSTLLLVAPVTHDQWDFRLWVGFGDFAVFGGGDPATLWFGSPLWSFVPSLFSAMSAAMFVATGHGSLDSTAVFMKIAMGLAYCYTASEIVIRAPRRLHVQFALVSLLLPVGLYELAAGYRELFATAIAISSFIACSKNRLIVATILAVVAGSISEELLPLVLLPAAMALTGDVSRVRKLSSSIALAALGTILFATEWRLLIPHDVATGALSYRFGVAPLGGASWAGALRGLGLLPSWLPVGSPVFGGLAFSALSALPAFRLFDVVRTSHESYGRRFEAVVGIFIAFVAAFLLAFRGTDPNLWYSLTTIALWYFASAAPLNPVPLLLGALEGLAFYSTVGFRDFVSQAYFWPVDEGVLGTLSSTRFVFDIMASAMMYILIVSICIPNTPRLFSHLTAFLALFFVCAVLSSSTADLPLDIVILAAAGILIGALLARLLRTAARNTSVATQSTQAGLLILVLISAYFGLQSLLAGFCGAGTCMLAARSRFGACDFIFAGGTIAVIATQTGDGIVSHLGAAATVFLVVAIIIGAVGSRGEIISSKLFPWKT